MGSVREQVEFDVAEMFSRPRTTQLCRRFNLKAGYSADRRHCDEITGKTWDFNKKEDVKEFKRMRKRRRVGMLVVSPPCTKLSVLQNLRKTEMTQEEWEEAIRLAALGIEVCREQHKEGLGFVLEHPRSSKIWG